MTHEEANELVRRLAAVKRRRIQPPPPSPPGVSFFTVCWWTTVGCALGMVIALTLVATGLLRIQP